ncbi:MAG: peptidoglycan DD-metalloendopeptidase family protein [Proteobacteria bacterium]|nr:peptidoglycan DD-metalloendopeptidase family protein [Pseudomonadota bacterium]
MEYTYNNNNISRINLWDNRPFLITILFTLVAMLAILLGVESYHGQTQSIPESEIDSYVLPTPLQPTATHIITEPLVRNDYPPLSLSPILSMQTSEKPLPTIQVPMIATPNQAQSPERTEVWKTVTIKRGMTLNKVFSRLGIDSKTLASIMTLGNAVAPLKKLKLNQQIQLLLDGKNNLKEIKFPIDATQTFNLVRVGNKFQVKLIQIPVTTKTRVTSGKITGSFFSTAGKAGLTRAQAQQMLAIFAEQINFGALLHAGDKFNVIFTEHYAQNKKVKNGDILAVEFINKGKSYRAIRFVDPSGRFEYYDPNGYSYRKAFLRYPLNYTRINSKFNLHRLHPILRFIRPHKGVDFGAPYGAPIKAASDGRIAFQSWKLGYGKTVIIRHDGKYETLYGHMSRFANLKSGSYIKRGQVIGYVGKTGLASGPHLHYEFHINGQPHDPLKVQLPRSGTIAPQYRNAFLQKAKPLVMQLNSVNNKKSVKH